MADPSVQQRIDQWRKMTAEDPSNALGWFSLGNACRQAGLAEEAAQAFRKAIEQDPGFSRAYQLLGQLLIDAGLTNQAAEVLGRGYQVAAGRGDVMPQKAMASLLEKIGAPVPDLPQPDQPAPSLTDQQVLDRRTGQPGPRLADPPMRGPVGRYIYDHYSQTTWTQWLHMGTKVINELRLDFSNPQHQKIYEQHMMEWLGFTEQDVQDHARRQAEP